MAETLRIRPARSRRIATFILVLLAVVGVLAGLVGWKIVRINAAIAAHSFARPPIEVAAMTVAGERLPINLDAIGSLTAIREVDLAPEVAGRVVAIGFEAGQSVSKGDTLLQLDDRLERAQLKAAIAGADYARQQLDRSRALEASRSESRATLQQRQSEFDTAQAVVEQLETQIAHKAVLAPFDGSLGIRDVSLGQYLSPGTRIATLTALDELYVNFAVPQQELKRLKIGGTVAVRTDALPDQQFVAEISAIDPVVDANTRNVSVQATLGNTPDTGLRPGLFVNVSLEIDVRTNVVLLPATAVQASASGDTAYLVKDGKVEIVPITAGQRFGDRVVVEQGLSAGDVVITSGQLRVYTGADVAVAPPKN